MWFLNVFIPNAYACRVGSAPIVLSFDGLGSHETHELKQIAYDYEIILFALPSKTTHKLQPLDVGIYGRVQTEWQDLCDRCLAEGIQIDRFNVTHEYASI